MLKTIPFLCALACVVSSTFADEKSKSQAGALAVEVADDLSIQDRAEKELRFKVYYPKTGGPYPVIVFSHGFGGNKDSFAAVGKHWASHGYIVIHPTHADGLGRQGSDESNKEVNNAGLRGRLGVLRGEISEASRISGRVADLVLVLDNLETLPKMVPGLDGKIDLQKIGVAGHSFGAYSAMLIGGVTTDLGQEKGKSFRDKRVKCILPISAQGTGQQGLTEQSWRALQLPMMTITGTRDRGVGGQDVEWRKEPYKYSPAGDKYLVVIEGANHLSYGGGLRAGGGGVPEIVNRCTTYYWDAYLKNSKDAKDFLKTGKLQQDAAGKFTLETK